MLNTKYSILNTKKVKPLTWVAIGVVVMLAPVVYFTARVPPSAEAAWFNDSWQYRKLTGFGNTGAADSNKKVKFDIDTSALITAGQLQSDCDDVRFTDINGKLLRYYLDSSGGACNTTSTDFYVLVPSITTGTNALYFYYGNPSALAGTEAANFSEATFTPTSGPAQGSEEASPGPTGWWKLNEGVDNTCSGGTNDACDTSQNGNDGVRNNATWQTENFCTSGTCLFFDGTNDDVTVADDDTLDIADSVDFSISVWVKFSALSSDRAIITKKTSQTNTDAGYMLFYNSSSGIIDFRVSDATDQFIVSSSTFTTTNEWVHITAVFDESSATNSTIYINGVDKKASTTGTIASVNSLANGIAFIVGTQGNGSSDLAGYIDEVKLYRYARTAAQAKAGAQKGPLGEGAAAVMGATDTSFLSDGLVGYWPMDETTINSCTGGSNDTCDASGNGFDGAYSVTMDATNIRGGKFGNGTLYDNTDSTVTSWVNNFTPTDVTFAGWFYPTSTGGVRWLMNKYAGTADEWGVRINSGALYLYDDIDDANEELYATSIGTNQWYHIVITMENLENKMYLNGVLVGSGNLASDTLASLSGDFHVGAREENDTSNEFDGTADDIRIYNRALSSREVAALYNWAPGPVGYWNMDEASGSTAFDRSGNGNDGTITEAIYAQGKFGDALDFDGSNDRVEIADDDILDIMDTNFTVMAWVQRQGGAAFGSPMGIVSKRNFDSGSGYDLKMDANTDCSWATNNINGICMRINDGTDGYVYGVDTTVFDDGLWHHVTVTFDQVTESNNVVYIDGVAQTTSYSGTLADIDTVNTTVASCIGKAVSGTGCSTSTNNNMNGLIDEVKIYNYARTQQQIVEDMNAGHPAGGSPVGSQLAYWKLNEQYGSTIRNAVESQTLLTGSITGAAWRTKANCKYEGCLLIDGTDDFVDAASPTALDNFFVGGGTITAWINATTFGENSRGRIVSKTGPSASSTGHAFYVDNADCTNCLSFFHDATSDGLWNTPTNSISTGSWIHVAVTFDKDSINSTPTMYINGKPQTITENQDPSGSFTDDGTVNLYIGNRQTDLDRTFDGLIDDVKIYDSVLTAEQILLDMNANASINFGTGTNEAEVLLDDGAGNPPIGWWSFDEKTGTSVNDISGTGATGTWNGSSPYWTSGKLGSAGNFNGSNSYVSLTATQSTFGYTNKLTAEAWFYDRGTVGSAIFGDIEGTNSQWLISLDSGEIYGQVGTVTCPWGTVNTGTVVVSTNTWTHVTFVYDGTSGVYLYINGVLRASNLTACGNLGTADQILIGAWENAAVYTPVDGKIDEVKLYDYVRTPAQVAYDYNRGKPIAHWKLNDCSGATALDASGNGYNGSVIAGDTTGSNDFVGTCSSTQSDEMWNNGTNGKIGASLDFDGTNDYVGVGDLSFTEGASQLTWSLWINPATLSIAKLMLSKCNIDAGSPTQCVFSLSTGGSDSDLLAISIPTTATDAGTYGYIDNLLTTGSWMHIVAVFDGTLSGNSNRLKVYVNGKLRTDTQYSGTIPATTVSSSTANATIAAPSDLISGTFFDGQIDDVRIYNYAVSADQVKQIMNEGGGVRFGPSSGSP